MHDKHILIVEDENVTRFNLVNLFKSEGYTVSEAVDGDEMEKKLASEPIDLVIMDINLPGKNGLLLAREIKNSSSLGLIFLTGRDNDVDKILGLEIGADDYLTKPFNPRELTIRARNILNRLISPLNSPVSNLIKFNQWKLDTNSREMTSPKGDVFSIPKGEFRVLQTLIENSGKIVTREELIKNMTGRALRSNDRTVDVTIRRLRKHFESVSNTPELINTIHGEGYRFVGSLE